MGSAYQFHSWRVFVLVCAFPSVFAIGALTTQPESPRFFLEVNGLLWWGGGGDKDASCGVGSLLGLLPPSCTHDSRGPYLASFVLNCLQRGLERSGNLPIYGWLKILQAQDEIHSSAPQLHLSLAQIGMWLDHHFPRCRFSLSVLLKKYLGPMLSSVPLQLPPQFSPESDHALLYPSSG